MSPSYHKLRQAKQKERSAKGVAARERLRMERAKLCDGWTQFEVLLRFAVSPDGRRVGLRVGESWEMCGSERSVRSKLSKAIWRKTNGNQARRQVDAAQYDHQDSAPAPGLP